MTVDETRRRLGVAQVEALFGNILLATSAAYAAGLILALGLLSLGFAKPWTALAWFCYLSAVAACNLALRRLYRRAPDAGGRWRVWAFRFTAINFAVGVGFGWLPFALAVGGGGEARFFTLLVTLCVAAGSIAAFSPYLPTFLCFFLPATVPYAAASFFSADPIWHRLGPPLMLLFIGGMGGLGVKANRSFKELVNLRIRAEKAAADLRREKEIAEAANRAKSTFLAAASHDLRQPVHALGLFVAAMRRVAMAPEGRRLIQQIEGSIDALDSLFTALLDISRLDAGAVAVQRRPFAIRSTMERVCRDYIQEAEAKGVSLVWKDCDAVVDTDPVLMERILRNFVSNAVRYTDLGRIVVGCRRRGAAIWLQVWDTGVGIPADQQARVFQEYYQLGNPERDRAKGLGLGLAIVKRLSDLLGCELRLRSEPGKGSCFEVRMPLAGQPAEPEAPSPADWRRALVGRLIVVVDDEPAIREAMSSLLTGWGHSVVAAGSGDEAMLSLSTSLTRPDLLICDYRLRGDENGVDVIERLRSEFNASIPAMLITGDTAPNRLAEAEASGFLLLHKPVASGKLRAAVVDLTGSAAEGDPSDAHVSLFK